MNISIHKAIFVTLTILAFLVVVPTTALAHPGRTAADGCHYCRTNCDTWGVPWDERHCHGASPSSVEEVSTPVAPKVIPSPKIVAPSPTVRPSTKPKVSPKPIICSGTSDNHCPSHCSAGNDADCCAQRLSDYQWYDNWGCYPRQLRCSATADGKCDSYCTAGNDADCCTQRLSNYAWYENRGCYPKE